MYDAFIHGGLRSPRPDRIEPPAGERPAPQEPPPGEGRSLPFPPGLYGLPRVLGAGGVKPALPPQPPRESQLVQADQGKEGPPHRCPRHPQEPADGPHPSSPPARVNNSSISATRSCVLLPRRAPLATNAMSYSFRARGATSRHAAFKTRRARFRGTAPPTRRPATNALVPARGATTPPTRVPFNRFPEDRTLPTAVWRV